MPGGGSSAEEHRSAQAAASGPPPPTPADFGTSTQAPRGRASTGRTPWTRARSHLAGAKPDEPRDHVNRSSRKHSATAEMRLVLLRMRAHPSEAALCMQSRCLRNVATPAERGEGRSAHLAHGHGVDCVLPILSLAVAQATEAHCHHHNITTSLSNGMLVRICRRTCLAYTWSRFSAVGQSTVPIRMPVHEKIFVHDCTKKMWMCCFAMLLMKSGQGRGRTAKATR